MQDANRVLAQLEHFEVSLDLILSFSPKFHLFFLTLAKGSIGVYVIVVGFLPKNAQEGPIPLLSLAFPVLFNPLIIQIDIIIMEKRFQRSAR